MPGWWGVDVIPFELHQEYRCTGELVRRIESIRNGIMVRLFYCFEKYRTFLVGEGSGKACFYESTRLVTDSLNGLPVRLEGGR